MPVPGKETAMDRFDVFEEFLAKKDNVKAAAHFLQNVGPLYAGTIGLDGRPQVRPAAFAFEEGGALYFLTLKSSRMYAELSKTPYIQFCRYDEESRTTLRLSGKACFTENGEMIERACTSCPDVPESAGGDRKMLILFFLLGAELLLEMPGTETEERKLRLTDPSGVLVGITIRKKTELRGRLQRILERREAEPPAPDSESARLYDGALFVFAEAGKALWPRMDIRPLERSAVFETYDDRERYTGLAAAAIGNAVIDDPEDMTYWLDPERWTGAEFRP